MPYKDPEKAREKSKEYKRKYRLEHPEEYRAKAKAYCERTKQHRIEYARKRYPLIKEQQIQRDRQKIRKNKLFIITACGGKCNVCGVEYNGNNSAIFDFHHTDASMKNRNTISIRSEEFIKEDLNRGFLVCANCHRMIHHGNITLGEA